MDRLMTKLAYSGILERRFQMTHLIVNYSILALACIAYLAFDLPESIFTWAVLPGALIFLASVQALSYRRVIEGGDPLTLLNSLMR
jgi:hypothetical protein